MSTTPERLANLTREEARLRAEAVSDTTYEIHLEFTAGARGYTGRTTVGFTAVRTDRPLFVDFVGRAVESIVLNGRAVRLDAYSGPRIHHPADGLVAGRNACTVAYACDYDLESVGLHHFLDPADGGEYLYTDFEPADANRVFPCFDQPDLKATFAITVGAPPAWQVVSNMAPGARTVEGDRTRWTFAITPRISTYLMNVSAGDYQVWEDRQARVPSRILARRSLAKFVDSPELFAITRKGFDWYERYFEVPYPFGKYDQIFVPEFKTGAMENVGAVVITDSVLFRHQPTAEESVDRAILMLHEMAHMWFGNLVTMRWWDGLWLNESFATYMSFLAAESVTDYQEIWQFFDARLRRWALWQDELSTTHPIEMDVAETRGCFNNFDGITYGKGCCVLKQLVFRLGAEPFRRGVAAYLKKYSWQNTSNLDFIRSLEEAADTDLGEWERIWLHSAGVNTLSPELAVSGGAITSLAIRQSIGNGDARLKEHRLVLGLFRRAQGGFELTCALPASVAGAESAVPAAGRPEPAFVHPNLGFEAYAKTTLDPRSLAAIEEGLARFPDAGVRSGLVDILRSMLMDAHIAPQAYLATVLGLLPGEPSSQILDALSRSVPMVLGHHLPLGSRTPPALKLHALSSAELASGRHAPGVQRLWFRFHVGSAFGDAALDGLEKLLGDKPPFPLDQDMRWDVLLHRARYRADAGLVAAEEKRDATDRGARRAIAIRASLPDAAGKRAMWDRFLSDRTTSLELLKAGFDGFHQPDQSALLAPFADTYLAVLPEVASGRSMEFAMYFADELFPTFHDEPAFMQRLEALLADPPVPPALVRIMKERRDDLVRLSKIRALNRSSSTSGASA